MSKCEPHILVTGDAWQYVPFGRARIKALRATGLNYATQQFEIDGCSIKVRIEGEQEFIRVSGGACKTMMDSGVAYLLSVTPASGSDAYTPARLNWTDHVKQYNTSFTEHVYRNSVLWMENPSKNSSGQMSGKLRISDHVKGAVLPDKEVSAAFSAGEKADSSTEPPTWSQEESDIHLLSKKLTVEYCPASIFTGRCRLYVQALYGQPLYPNGTRKPKSDHTPGLYEMPYSQNATPSIRVKSFVRAGEIPRFDEVLVTSSSGVHLDKTTGEHWLINIEGGDQITFFPLVASPCVEKFRKWITSESKKGLSEEDREHLETYILGDSLPDTTNWQKVVLVKPSTWSLGYGWHWNYSGNCADMVVNAQYAQDNEPLPNSGLSSGVGVYFGMESTHYRITVSLAQTWSATLQTVRGPSKWSAPAGVVILTEVDWSTRNLIKVLPKYTIPHNSSATFYAFYVKDELKTCDVTVVVTPPKQPHAEFSDATYYTGYANTLGLGGGWSRNYSAEGETYSGTISCGGVSCPFSGFGKNSGETRVTNKTYDGFDTSNVPIGQGSGVLGDFSTYVDYPPYQIVSFPYPEPIEGVSFGAEVVEMPGNVYYDYTTSVTQESQGAYCVVIPPMNDSEAVYIVAKTHNILYRTGSIRTNYRAAVGNFMSASEYRSITSPGGTFRSGPLVRYTWGGNGGSTAISSGPIDDELIDTVIFESNTLICGAGEFSLKEDYAPGYTLLGVTEDSPDAYETRTSASGKAMTADPNKIDTVGFELEVLNVATTKLPAFLGWA